MWTIAKIYFAKRNTVLRIKEGTKRQIREGEAAAVARGSFQTEYALNQELHFNASGYRTRGFSSPEAGSSGCTSCISSGHRRSTSPVERRIKTTHTRPRKQRKREEIQVNPERLFVVPSLSSCLLCIWISVICVMLVLKQRN